MHISRGQHGSMKSSQRSDRANENTLGFYKGNCFPRTPCTPQLTLLHVSGGGGREPSRSLRSFRRPRRQPPLRFGLWLTFWDAQCHVRSFQHTAPQKAVQNNELVHPFSELQILTWAWNLRSPSFCLFGPGLRTSTVIKGSPK